MLQIGNQDAVRIKTQKQSLVPAKALILIGIVVRGIVQSQSEILGIGEQMAQVYWYERLLLLTLIKMERTSNAYVSELYKQIHD